ncbi:MAG: Na+/H+ antiporter NhaC family protein [Halanaerobium sp.]|nr:Na+/H+ antiporter NhaC family protein [Halanaerobium sp.]
MFAEPTLWGLLPLVVFIILVFRKWHPVAATTAALIIAAIMGGQSLIDVASSVKSGMGSFIAYVGLIIMAGGGLGKITEKTGVAPRIVHFVMDRVGVNTPTKAIIGTMIVSCLLVALLGTLAGANALIAPVIIPIVAAAGLSSSVVAVIFQGAGATGLFLGPFTPPMVTLIKYSGLTYPQILLYAGLPVSIILWISTFFYSKKILPGTIKEHAYTEKDMAVLHQRNDMDETEKKNSLRATYAFLITLIGLITYGIIIKGGSTFAIFVIITTAIVTGLAGRLHPNKIAEYFAEGAKPLVWLFIQFVLFSPFIQFIQDLGAFEALKNLLMPLIQSGGKTTLFIISSLVGIAGIPGAAVAQVVVIHEMFISIVRELGLGMTAWVLVLLVGSQITFFLYPTGDTLGAMGIARSKDIKNMVIFGVVATIPVVIFVILRALLL